MTDDLTEVAAWAASGAMALTGTPTRPPLGPPAGFVPQLVALADRLRVHTDGAVHVDAVALLGERAAIAGLHRGGQVSCGGSTRLLPSHDGWLAIGLPRPNDVELVPAWLGLPELPDDLWACVASGVARERAADLAARGALLGLPVAALPPTGTIEREAVLRTRVAGLVTHVRPLAELTVVDLSALWAGPLCGSLLAQAGATIVKVESITRPDGARSGPTAFFDLMNAGKRSVALDLRRADGVAALRRLLLGADVVIESSRPRALEHFGVHAEDVLASGRTRVWASITGHGRTGGDRNRVALGDDAAVAGGLVAWDGDQPVFCADAIADPLSGLVAADAVLAALAEGGRWLLDVSMAGVAASFAGSTLSRPDAVEVAAPRARPQIGRGPRLGEHTASVLGALAA